jgi:hypothetical protein
MSLEAALFWLNLLLKLQVKRTGTEAVYIKRTQCCNNACAPKAERV